MGANYEDINLTDKLQAKDSLAVKQEYVNNTQFDTNYEATARSIRDTFQVVKTGTIGLSGTNNTTDYTIGTVNHNLGAAPAIIAYSLINFGGSTQYSQLPLVADTTSGLTIDIGGGTTVIAGFSMSNLFYVTGINSCLFIFDGAAHALGSYGGAGVPWNYSIKYYLLRERAT